MKHVKFDPYDNKRWTVCLLPDEETIGYIKQDGPRSFSLKIRDTDIPGVRIVGEGHGILLRKQAADAVIRAYIAKPESKLEKAKAALEEVKALEK